VRCVLVLLHGMFRGPGGYVRQVAIMAT
jgi:hypothetical protein